MTDVAVRGTSDLAIVPDQTNWTDKQVAALKQLGVKDASNADLAVFFHQATRTGLDPFAKQIYMLGRKTKEGVKQTIQTGIDGYRLIARRAVDRAGETLAYDPPEWCGEDGVWRDAWFASRPPAAARVTVLRNGQSFPGVATYAEYVQTNYDGTPNPMWKKMPANQLAKCAEAAALRKAFPQDLSGLYIEDEMPSGNPRIVDQPQRTRLTAAEITRPKPTALDPTPGEHVDTATGEVHDALPVEDPPAGWDDAPVAEVKP